MSCDNDTLDGIISILEALKKRNKALGFLGEAHMNLLFQEPVFQDHKQKWVDHVKDCIFKAMVALDGASK